MYRTHRFLQGAFVGLDDAIGLDGPPGPALVLGQMAGVHLLPAFEDRHDKAPGRIHLVARAEKEENRPLPLDMDARQAMIVMADGDGRAAINLADEVFAAVAPGQAPLNRAALSTLVQKRAPLYDKSREGHLQPDQRAA